MRRLLYIGLFILIAIGASAQDLQLTQFYASPMYLNPAFTGTTRDSRLSTIYRNQWTGLPKSYRSFLASYDYFMYNYNSGIGGIIISDKSGTQGLSNNMVGLCYSYEYKFHRLWSAAMGMRAAYGWRSLDIESLLFGDQIARNSPTSLQAPFYEKVNFLDMSAGILVYSAMEWVGLSFNHINSPNESFLGQDSYIPIKGSFHGGINIPLAGAGGAGRTDEKPVMIAAFQYRFQKEFDQLDLGFYVKKPQFFGGIWYRGLPGVKAYKPGYPNNDSMSILLGAIYKKMLTLGYSYDFNISKLGPDCGGTHEISLSYLISNPKKPKKHSNKIVPCPKI